MKLWNKAMKI